MGIAEDLDLDVARAFDEAFEIDRAITEGGEGDALGTRVSVQQLR